MSKRSIGFVTETADAEGRFTFEKLPPGKARMELMYNGQRTLQIVAIKSGETVDHDITLPPQVFGVTGLGLTREKSI